MQSHDENPGSIPDENHDESNEQDQTKNMSKSQRPRIPVSRRGALAALAGIGGLTLSSRSGQASHKGLHWKKDVDAGENTLFNLGGLSMAANPTEITDFVGDLLEL